MVHVHLITGIPQTAIPHILPVTVVHGIIMNVSIIKLVSMVLA